MKTTAETKTRIELGDIPRVVCEEMLKNNSGYFQLMNVIICYFRSREKK